MSPEKIAMICHEANRAYCIAIGDNSPPRWDYAPEWQKVSAIAGVEFRIKHPDATPESMHNSWMNQKTLDGWVHGLTKDPVKKEHPCMVSYELLPHEQKIKDHLFSAIFDAVRADA